jgi:hypothetical protein
MASHLTSARTKNQVTTSCEDVLKLRKDYDSYDNVSSMLINLIPSLIQLLPYLSLANQLRLKPL